MRFFRAGAAFAISRFYGMLETEGCFQAVCLKGNNVLQEKAACLLKHLVGRPPSHVLRICHDFEYRAASRYTGRRVAARVEWHPGELFARAGLAVTSLPMEPEDVIRFYNQRSTADQHVREGTHAIDWTRLSCKRFRDNEVRLRLNALACNPGSFLQRTGVAEDMADRPLTSLQSHLIGSGAHVVCHARAITFQLAEIALDGRLFGQSRSPFATLYQGSDFVTLVGFPNCR